MVNLYRISVIISLVFLTKTGFTQSENKKITDDCITVQEITVPFNGKQFVANTNEDVSNSYNLVYYADEDEYTFWYKLIITENCNLTFSVKASTPGDDYDFMLYKFTSTNFCESLVDNVALPLNNNYYEPDLEQNKGDIMVAGQKEMPVKKGEVYYISVMNILGEDCGHRLFINACGNSIMINSVHKPCFLFSQPKVAAPVTSTNNTTPITEEYTTTELALSDTIIVDDYVTIKGMVRDNDNGKPINSKITFVDEVTAKEYTTEANENTGFVVELERGRRYHIKCEAFGYYDIKGVIEFLKPSVYDFYLLKIKEGRTFVMNNILFYPSTYALKEQSFAELDKLVHYMKVNPKLKIQIEGHTAGDTPVKAVKPEYRHLGEEWNFTGTAKKLSKLRASSVKHYLVEKGVSSSKVLIEGFGASKKRIPNPKSKEEKMLNMRVEVKIINRGEGKDHSINAGKSP